MRITAAQRPRTRTASGPPWTGSCAARSRPAASATSRPSPARPASTAPPSTAPAPTPTSAPSSSTDSTLCSKPETSPTPRRPRSPAQGGERQAQERLAQAKQRSANSRTSAARPWPGSLHSTTRSSGSEQRPTREPISPACHRRGRKSSGHADPLGSDIHHIRLGVIATHWETSVANSASRIGHVKRNTNPTAHSHCGDKAHPGHQPAARRRQPHPYPHLPRPGQ